MSRDPNSDIPGFEGEYYGTVGHEKKHHRTHFTMPEMPWKKEGQMKCKWCGKEIKYEEHDAVYFHVESGGYWCEDKKHSATPSYLLVCAECGYHQKREQLVDGKCYNCGGSVE